MTSNPCKCGSHKIIGINAKSSDLNNIEFYNPDNECWDEAKEQMEEYNQDRNRCGNPFGEHEGYIPPPCKRIGGGDYINFSYCDDCGMIQ